jgi:hypothetical protein
MSDTPPKGAPAGLTEHINRFQRRARFHFMMSYAILLVVFLLTGFAVYIFLFAQEIDRSRGSVELWLVSKRRSDPNGCGHGRTGRAAVCIACRWFTDRHTDPEPALGL